MSDRKDGSAVAPIPNQIGYGRPPMKRRFKDSGNPKGRPKGSKNCKTIIKEIANKMHRVKENGKVCQRSTLELALLRLRHLAAEGPPLKAVDEMHRLLKTYQPQSADDDLGYLVAPADISAEEWIAEQERLNKDRVDPRIKAADEKEAEKQKQDKESP